MNMYFQALAADTDRFFSLKFPKRFGDSRKKRRAWVKATRLRARKWTQYVHDTIMLKHMQAEQAAITGAAVELDRVLEKPVTHVIISPDVDVDLMSAFKRLNVEFVTFDEAHLLKQTKRAFGVDDDT